MANADGVSVPCCFHWSSWIIENQLKLCYMTVLQIKNNSEEKEVALRPPHASAKWSNAGSDDIVFNKTGFDLD